MPSIFMMVFPTGDLISTTSITKLVVKDVDKHVNVNRNTYYGGHHLVRDWHGARGNFGG